MAMLASHCLVRRCRRGAWQLAGRASGVNLSQLRARSAVMTPTLLPPRSLRPLSLSFYKPTKSSIEPHSSLTPTSLSIWSCNKTFLPSPNPNYFQNDHSNTELTAGANSFAHHFHISYNRNTFSAHDGHTYETDPAGEAKGRACMPLHCL